MILIFLGVFFILQNMIFCSVELYINLLVIGIFINNWSNEKYGTLFFKSHKFFNFCQLKKIRLTHYNDNITLYIFYSF